MIKNRDDLDLFDKLCDLAKMISQWNVEESFERDRSKWGDGPWQHEPDRLEFRAYGFDCLMTRQEKSGHLCGYVAVPQGHPAFDKPWNELENLLTVHGNVTYAERCRADVCHKADEGAPEVYWVGFDCAHADDLQPAYKLKDPDSEIYRDVPYVTDQIKSLARQLYEMTLSPSGEASGLS